MAYGIYGMGNMYGTQSSMGTSTQNSGNTLQHFKSKYGCSMCSQQGPVVRLLPIETLPMTEQERNPSFFSRIIHKIFG